MAGQTTKITLREEYLAGDAVRARHLVDRAAGDGVSIAELYLGVLEPAMEEIGARWEAVPPYAVVGGRAWSALPEGESQTMGADARIGRPAELVELVVERFPPVED